MAKAPQTRKLTLVAIGQVTDRTCKTGRVKFSFDPTPDAFLLKSKARETPVAVLITPDEQHKEIRPISMFRIVKGCTLEMESVMVAPDRLADLEFLIRETNAVVKLHIEAEAAELFDPAAGDGNG